jgi:phosphoribosyl 1,2-cyclic phosphodiesterase
VRVLPLGSGSLGNATLVESGGTRLLVDAGLPIEDLEARLTAVGADPASIDAVFVTHRHHDHIRSANVFAVRHRARIYTTSATARALGTECHRRLTRIEALRPFRHGALELIAVPIEHDAPHTMALRVADGRFAYGHATDLGCTDGPIRDWLADCDSLLLEFNHDLELLEQGSDPPFLKARIRSRLGHLDNRSAAALLRELTGPRLRQVWLAHLSRRNNRPELALAAARAALDSDRHPTITVAAQDEPSAGWTAPQVDAPV